MYLDYIDHIILKAVTNVISEETGVAKRKANEILIEAIDDSEFTDFVIEWSKRQGFIPNE